MPGFKEPALPSATERYPGSQLDDTLKEKYLDWESIPPEKLRYFLQQGELMNMRVIEDFLSEVQAHSSRVEIGDLRQPAALPLHNHSVFEAEMQVEGEKPLLIIFKPDHGFNQGTNHLRFRPPADSSPPSYKDASTVLIYQALGLSNLVTPTEVRKDPEGNFGAIRPYLYGSDLSQFSQEDQLRFYQKSQILENIAIADYMLQILDRERNILWDGADNQKLIDGALTFFADYSVDQYDIKTITPRALVKRGFTRPNHQKGQPVPLSEEQISNLISFVEHQDEITQKLLNLYEEEGNKLGLSKEEAAYPFFLAGKLIKKKVFL